MTYIFNEYKQIFDTPAKKQQEKVIVEKIMGLLNKNKYDNLSEFISRNGNYQDFLKNNQMDNVVKHFGNTLNEENYKNILDSLNKLTIDKENFATNNIETTKIDDKEYNSFTGEEKEYFIDNSNSNKKIEEQMDDLQSTDSNFQTADINKNTENMFKELESRKKETLNLHYLNEINTDSLNNNEKLLYQVAVNYQLDKGEVIRVDLQKGVLVDKNNDIRQIKSENGEITIKGDDNKVDTPENLENSNSKAIQKQLGTMPNPNTIYSNN